ncbi:23S rRNA (adenine(1618)-N(6))-methyltransferase RlmF [Pedobacter heparinus]|uniref:Ribosomal RNA large subunit methyltransferase F n=1 Tax=Pedobacter heparinus (strain ATCC 13125 / DSM 2366 / CIP 104194 / JCM 7457 / NBRC 12017 / NCIMB 9290 / NRRL B-14731 / HIM 762-3) TaxID=485917 RepID=C6XZZ0_PEDHD|nr:23S rRNA (adenine(1618)-N(6))-methyltransferase RlmF [Pedobacter heparinus]ACU02685.1 rRNA (adenine-N(6)-)-methyltransferase [Pedobacter heparinus DSM 2366]
MSEEKTILHPRNKHRSRYNFPELIKTLPELYPFVAVNSYGGESIDFSDPVAVKLLNKALLKHFYGIDNWDIPANYLCPPIPGRADYVHYLADLLARNNKGIVPKGNRVKGLDIGIGANCIYPIIGLREYGWSFVGSDTDQGAIKTAKAIVAANSLLTGAVSCRLQPNPKDIFKGIVKPGELFDFTMCNPPFHASAAEAQSGTKRKLQNLGKHTGKETVLNFGGQQAELWYDGGELAFIRNMINDSMAIANQCLWFSSLVSKSSNLSFIYKALQGAGALQVKTIEMAQGQKISRFVAWSFLTEAAQQQWMGTRWR